MNAIYLIGGIQAVYFAFVMLIQKPKTLQNRLLMGLYFNVAALLAFEYGFSFYEDTQVSISVTLFIATLGPLMHLHFNRMYAGESRLAQLIHFLPALILVSYAVFGDKQIARILAFAVLFTYSAFGLLQSRFYLSALKNTYDGVDAYTKNWIYILSGSMAFVAISGLLPYVFPVLADNSVINFSGFYYAASLTISLFFVGTISIMKRDENVMRSVLKTAKHSDAARYFDKIKSFVETEKVYLQQDLNVHVLAEHLNMRPNILSEEIKIHSGKNFSQFVNDYRVEEVKKRLEAGAADEFTLLAIAFDCGFNSKASFNRVFKENTGMTPRQYQKSVAEKQNTAEK
jgi:AraC-like DNA-binding protein